MRRMTASVSLGASGFLVVAFVFFSAISVWPQSSSVPPKDPPAKGQAPAANPAKRDDRPSATQDKKAAEQEAIRLGVDLVTVTVTVTDPYGRFVTGLDRDHFAIFEDKVRQKMEFFSDEDAPVSLGIIFDISGSMKNRIGRANHALQRFLESSHNEDDIFLVGFNQSTQVLSDFTSDTARLINSLVHIEPKGQTALYDAAYLGVEKVKQGRHAKRALIVISDGQDNQSRYTFQELRKLVKEADVQIYAIGITEFGSSDPLDTQGQAILEEVSRITGGRAFFPTNEVELEEVVMRIALELRHQYSVGYVSLDQARDGRWRKIRVQVNPPKGLPRLFVRSKEGYYGPRS